MGDLPTTDRLVLKVERLQQKITLLEELIESKTRELFVANQDLEARVAERTRELAAALEAAEAASRAKRAFIAHVSHELRTPLHAIRGMAEVVAARNHDPTVDPMLDTIRSSGDHMLRLVNQLLDLSWLTRDGMPLDEEPTSLRKLLDDVVATLAVPASAKRIAVVAEVRGLLPTASVDPMRLKEILLNFGGNAVKFTDRGEVRIRASVAVEGPMCVVSWAVVDTGCGMDAETVSRVFDPFFQAKDTYRREHGGAGLGMSIARRLVQAMGGEVVVESAVGVGTSIHFTTRHAMLDASLTPTPATTVEKLAPLKVLVVDDQPANCQVAQAVLHILGCEATTTKDAFEGLRLADGGGFDVWMLDYHMPSMDGVALLRELRSRGAACPALLVTADLTPAARSAAAAVGATLLPKPYTAAELRAAIAAVVPGSGRRDASVDDEVAPNPYAGHAWMDAPLFDVSDALERLACEASELVGVCESFLRTIPEAMDRISGPDGSDRRAAAHGMRGAALSLGAKRLAELSLRIELGDGTLLAAGVYADVARATAEAVERWCARVRRPISSPHPPL